MQVPVVFFSVRPQDAELDGRSLPDESTPWEPSTETPSSETTRSATLPGGAVPVHDPLLPTLQVSSLTV